MYKVNDYEKEDFKRITNKDGLNTYFIKVNRIYVEVDKEIYLTCLRSYMKIKYNKEREVANSVQYYSDMDLATSFIFCKNKKFDFVHQIYVILKEMTISETAKKLNIPVSTVGKRKIKIQQILKNKLKK